MSDVIDAIISAPRTGRRNLVALAGPPASGKSTLAAQLCTQLVARGCAAVVVPMDGFHLDNAVLTERGLLDRKGAPETFDAVGFVQLIAALAVQDQVTYPLFDRTNDKSIADAGVVGPDCDTVLVEGNYLLYDAPVWRDLAACWDLAIRLNVGLPELEARLVRRWLDHGLPQAQAEARAQGNDLRNAQLVLDHALPADRVIGT